MKSLGLISQILVIGLSVAIAVLYIRPTFQEIGTIQTDISEYAEQRAKVEKVNTDLARLVAAQEAISPSDFEKLVTYMPKGVDEISVMRDIQFILTEASLIFKSVTFEGLAANTAKEIASGERKETDASPYSFGVEAEGTYLQIKNFLSFLEQNHYPLEVSTLSITALDGGFLSISAQLITYADSEVSDE